MRRNAASRVCKARVKRGFTMTEMLIASSITILISGAVMALVYLTARDVKNNLAASRVQREAGNLQDRMIRELRNMSSNESMILGDLVALPGGGNAYRRIITSRGKIYDAEIGKLVAYPKEEFVYDPDERSLIHVLNRTTGASEAMFESRDQIVLRDLYFYPSINSLGLPDYTLINVYFEMDDNRTGRKFVAGAQIRQQAVKFFTVKMRNR